MARQANPYRPGFNQAPLVFAGRDDIIDGASEALEVAALDGRTPRPLTLIGPRGLGKTVALGEISSIAAERYSWPTVHVEATTSGALLSALIVRLQSTAALLEGRQPSDRAERRTRVTGGTLEAKAFGVGGSINIEAQRLESDLETTFRTTMQVAADRGAGVLITLDELQNAHPDELRIIGGVLQENVPHRWPLVLAAAALPSLRSSRGPRKLPTYFERSEWHELHALSDADARQALIEPAATAGRPMDPSAADILLALAGGYPYAIQVCGHFAWRASHGAPTITTVHAEAAAPKINADLTQLFKSRWDDASPREQQYLYALATATSNLDRPPNGGDVAATLGEPVTEVSYLRDRLLKKGTIYNDGHNGLHFITPGMAAWIRDQV